MSGSGARESAYQSGWKPGGASSVFSFLPRINVYTTSGRRRYSEDGSMDFGPGGLINTWVAETSFVGPTYFTTIDLLVGTYFEYWAGTDFCPLPPTSAPTDPRFGTLNRRYDRNGNVVQYTYSPSSGGTMSLLRKISGDLGGNVIPYFEYADDTASAPITKIFLCDLATPQNSRTVYFEYTYYTFFDPPNYYGEPYLSKIVSPNGCVRRYDPVTPIPTYGITQIKREVDPEGYETYFEYFGTILTKTVEPEGRINYYHYVTTSETRYALLGRPESFVFYGTASGGGEMPGVLQNTDALGNTTYYDYDLNAIRVGTQIDPNGNVTYFGYKNAAANRWALTKKVSGFNGAVTYFGYTPTTYDLVKEVGPRHTTSFPVTTYYSYDGRRNRIAVVDPAGGTTLYGRDGLGRIFQTLDALGNPSYFNYEASTGSLASQVDAVGSVSYFGFDSFVNLTRATSPRWAERNSIALFTSYFEYDSLDRKIKQVDTQGNITYFDWTSRGDLLDKVDPRGTTTAYTYNGLRLMTQRTVTDLAGGTLVQEKHGYDIYKNRVRTLNPRGYATYFAYDAIDRMTAAQDALLNVTYYGYDQVDNLVAQTNARNFATTLFYDSLSRKICTRDALGYLAYFGYDLADNLSRVLDPRRNATYFFYDPLNRLQARRDAQGNPSYFFYDLVGNATVTTNARFNSTYFSYDRMKRLAKQRDALGNATYYGYDAASNRTRILDALRNPVYFFYDTLDRLNSTVDALGNATYFGFDAVGNRTQLLDARGNATYFFYDGLNRTTVRVDALGNATYYQYDAGSNPVLERDGRGNATVYVYDPLDRLAMRANAAGNAILRSYDPVGNVAAQSRALTADQGYGLQSYGASPYGGAIALATSYFAYDGNNRLVTTVDELGAITYFEYDPLANPTKIVDARRNAAMVAYDELNRARASRDAMGNSTYYFYDPVNKRTVARNPLFHSTYYGYDALNRLVRMQNALGATAYFEFDGVGNPTKSTDQNNHATSTRYDALNRADALRMADGGSSYFFYDRVSNRTKVVNTRGAATYYAYDAINRQTGVQDALGRTIYFEFDPAGNLSTQTDAEAAYHVRAYDAANRRTQSTYTAAGATVSQSLAPTSYYAYDTAGDLAQMTDLWGLHSFAYDARRRRVRHTYPNGSHIYYEYDPVSNLTTRAYPGSAGRSGAAYDASNRQILVQSPSGATAYFSYDAASNLMRRLYGNGAKEVMTYDAAEQIATWRGADKNGAMLAYFDYTRDAKGLVVKCVREATHTTYHLYDANDRLVAETWLKGTGNKTAEVYGYRYAYDLAGNRTKARINGADTYYFYDQASQLKVTGTNAVYANPTYFFYDRNGSLTNWWDSGGATYFAYNAAGLAARIRWRDASATYFFYDGSLKRYAMVSAGQTAATYFLWDGPHLLQEQNADGTIKEEHTNTLTGTPGIGQLLESNRPGQAQPKLYPVMDSRGSILKWMQSDGTTVFASREYDTFGTLVPNAASGSWPGRFGYQGQTWMELLSANGAQRLLLSPTRLYDPSSGRFLQADPVLQNRSAQAYAYGKSDPFDAVDPTGMDDEAMMSLRKHLNEGEGKLMVIHDDYLTGDKHATNTGSVGIGLPSMQLSDNVSMQPSVSLDMMWWTADKTDTGSQKLNFGHTELVVDAVFPADPVDLRVVAGVGGTTHQPYNSMLNLFHEGPAHGSEPQSWSHDTALDMVTGRFEVHASKTGDLGNGWTYGMDVGAGYNSLYGPNVNASAYVQGDVFDWLNLKAYLEGCQFLGDGGGRIDTAPVEGRAGLEVEIKPINTILTASVDSATTGGKPNVYVGLGFDLGNVAGALGIGGGKR